MAKSFIVSSRVEMLAIVTERSTTGPMICAAVVRPKPRQAPKEEATDVLDRPLDGGEDDALPHGVGVERNLGREA